MGSLGLTATMAVRSAFALLCFALLCGLAASSGFQSETETELRTKNEGEAAGNQVLVADAVESRVARGSKKRRGKECMQRRPKVKEMPEANQEKQTGGKKQQQTQKQTQQERG